MTGKCSVCIFWGIGESDYRAPRWLLCAVPGAEDSQMQSHRLYGCPKWRRGRKDEDAAALDDLVEEVYAP